MAVHSLHDGLFPAVYWTQGSMVMRREHALMPLGRILRVGHVGRRLSGDRCVGEELKVLEARASVVVPRGY